MNLSGNEFIFDPVISFLYIEETKEEIFHMLRQLKNETGIKRALMVFPLFNGEAKGLSSLSAFEKFADSLYEVKERLAGDGIDIGWWCAPSLSIGPQVNMRNDSRYYFQKIVGIDGAVSEKANCPLDSNFQNFYKQCLQTIVKKARPSMIFFEDDFEISNHDVVQYGCFCPLHLGRFSVKVGEKMTREELEDIFRKCDDKAVKYRRAWAELMKDSLVELAAELRSAVDEIAPDTRMALCQPFCCDFDGDMTGHVAKALAGNTRPLVRLWGSDYNSDAADNFPALTFHFLYSRQNLDESFEFIHESDPYPHFRFFFSATKLRALMILSVIYGFDGSLFYNLQYTDGPLEEKGYTLMIKESRALLTELRRSVEGFKLAGPCILYRPYAHVHREICGAKAPISPFPGWALVLGRLGIPYTAHDGSGPVMTCGEDVRELSDEEIIELLRNGVFLDGLAAKHLCGRGYSELIGVNIKNMDKNDFQNISHERLTVNNVWRDNTEGTRIYFVDDASPVQNRLGVYMLESKSDCQVLSEFISENGEVMFPAVVMFKNRLGGRVAVTAYNLQQNHTASIFNYKRKDQFRGIIEWLAEKNLSVYVDGDPNVFVTALENSGNDDKIAAVFNMSLDEMREVKLVLDESWKKDYIFYLKDDGVWDMINDAVWKKNGINKFRLVVPRKCATLQPLVLRFVNQFYGPENCTSE